MVFAAGWGIYALHRLVDLAVAAGRSRPDQFKTYSESTKAEARKIARPYPSLLPYADAIAAEVDRALEKLTKLPPLEPPDSLEELVRGPAPAAPAAGGANGRPPEGGPAPQPGSS
jgi:hypothetical protein